MYQMYQQDRLTAEYNNGSWTILQKLDTIFLDKMVGSFDKAIAYLQKEKERYEFYLKEPYETYEICNNFGLDKSKVQFVEIIIRLASYGDKGDELEVCGKRAPIAVELRFLEKYRKQLEDSAAAYRRKQYEHLKVEFENYDRRRKEFERLKEEFEGV